MLSLSVIEEIERLLKQGELSQRRIAERLRVSRGTVGAMARGRRARFGCEPENENGDDQPSRISDGSFERCARCGYNVYMPCRICAARAYDARRRPLLIAALRSQQIVRQTDPCQDRTNGY